MKGVYLIFDYFKEAFHVNRENKALYKPQIALIIIQLLMFLGAGIGAYLLLRSNQLRLLFYGLIQLDKIWTILLSYGAGILTAILVYALISRVVQAGLYNMYKQCVVSGEIQQNAFWEGGKKYFLKFLMADLLLIGAWIIFAIFYLIIGVVTLSIGFAIVPMIISVFLTMWKVSMVMDDVSIFAALQRSLRFAKRHFIPLSILQLIHWAFTKGTESSSGGNGNISNVLQWRENNHSIGKNILPPAVSPDNIPAHDYGVETFINIAKIMTVILVPVITIATAVAALIKMVFEVFFSLALFIAYRDEFEEHPDQPEDKEVLA